MKQTVFKAAQLFLNIFFSSFQCHPISTGLRVLVRAPLSRALEEMFAM